MADQGPPPFLSRRNWPPDTNLVFDGSTGRSRWTYTRQFGKGGMPPVRLRRWIRHLSGSRSWSGIGRGSEYARSRISILRSPVQRVLPTALPDSSLQAVPYEITNTIRITELLQYHTEIPQSASCFPRQFQSFKRQAHCARYNGARDQRDSFLPRSTCAFNRFIMLNTAPPWRVRDPVWGAQLWLCQAKIHGAARNDFLQKHYTV